MLNRNLFLVIMYFLIFGCQPKNKQPYYSEPLSGQWSLIQNDLANGYKLMESESDKRIVLSNQWSIRDSFVFDKSKNVELFKASRIICLSTTHIGMLKALGLEDKIIAVSNGKWVYSQKIQNQISTGKTTDLGSEQSLSIERIISLEPDVVFAYGVNAKALKLEEQLKPFGISVLFVSEYLEETPLAQAEWIRMYGFLFDRLKEADSIYIKIKSNYENTIVKTPTSPPKVFCNSPWKGSWFCPGGKSFTAQLIRDAGGQYLWADDTRKGSLNLTFEQVYKKTKTADIWLNVGSAESLNSLKSEHHLFKNFNAIENQNVFNNNKRLNKDDGNDIWETGVIRPDLLLRDLSIIFAADSSKYYSLYFYEKLE